MLQWNLDNSKRHRFHAPQVHPIFDRYKNPKNRAHNVTTKISPSKFICSQIKLHFMHPEGQISVKSIRSGTSNH